MHTIAFAGGALEAKSARDSGHRLFLKWAWSGQITNRTSNGATRAIKSDKNYSYQAQLGVKKVDLLMQTACSRFAKKYFPLQPGAFFAFHEFSNYRNQRTHRICHFQNCASCLGGEHNFAFFHFSRYHQKHANRICLHFLPS